MSQNTPTINCMSPPRVYTDAALLSPSIHNNLLNSPSCSTPTVYTPNGTKKKPCNCKQSKCLKLYCECFASGGYCDPTTCNCEHESQRKAVIDNILEKNPHAFRKKVAQSPYAPKETKHYKGCNCKRSFCLKKYCECFQAGIVCGENCKCLECKNYENSQDRHNALEMSPYPVSSPSSTVSPIKIRPSPTTYSTILPSSSSNNNNSNLLSPSQSYNSPKKRKIDDTKPASPISTIITPSLLEDVTKRLLKAYLNGEKEKSIYMNNNNSNNSKKMEEEGSGNDENELYCYEKYKSNQYSRNEQYVLSAYYNCLLSINDSIKEYSRSSNCVDSTNNTNEYVIQSNNDNIPIPDAPSTSSTTINQSDGSFQPNSSTPALINIDSNNNVVYSHTD